MGEGFGIKVQELLGLLSCDAYPPTARLDLHDFFKRLPRKTIYSPQSPAYPEQSEEAQPDEVAVRTGGEPDLISEIHKRVLHGPTVQEGKDDIRE